MLDAGWECGAERASFRNGETTFANHSARPKSQRLANIDTTATFIGVILSSNLESLQTETFPVHIPLALLASQTRQLFRTSIEVFSGYGRKPFGRGTFERTPTQTRFEQVYSHLPHAPPGLFHGPTHARIALVNLQMDAAQRGLTVSGAGRA